MTMVKKNHFTVHKTDKGKKELEGLTYQVK